MEGGECARRPFGGRLLIFYLSAAARVFQGGGADKTNKSYTARCLPHAATYFAIHYEHLYTILLAIS